MHYSGRRLPLIPVHRRLRRYDHDAPARPGRPEHGGTTERPRIQSQPSHSTLFIRTNCACGGRSRHFHWPRSDDHGHLGVRPTWRGTDVGEMSVPPSPIRADSVSPWMPQWSVREPLPHSRRSVSTMEGWLLNDLACGPRRLRPSRVLDRDDRSGFDQHARRVDAPRRMQLLSHR